MSGRPDSAGNDAWPGVDKLAGEAAAVIQVVGKITGGDDTAVMRERLQQKLGDLRAAIDYVAGKNGLNWDAINRRRDASRALYEREAAPLPRRKGF